MTTIANLRELMFLRDAAESRERRAPTMRTIEDAIHARNELRDAAVNALPKLLAVVDEASAVAKELDLPSLRAALADLEKP